MVEAWKRYDASWFIPPPNGANGRILDPCSAEGEIASALGMLLNCETRGCELFPYRAEKAADRMVRCHGGPWRSCSLTYDPITVLWLKHPVMTTSMAKKSGESSPS